MSEFLPRKWIVIVGIIIIAVSYTFFPRRPLPKDVKVASLLLEKKKRDLRLLDANGKTIRKYHVSLGANPRGHKERQGDERTPEGKYMIDFRNSRSRFHKSLHISYPNSRDRSKAYRLGVDPGGDIMIHGLPDKYEWIGRWHRWWDWTDGCVGLTNSEIEEIWDAIGSRKIPIEVKP